MMRFALAITLLFPFAHSVFAQADRTMAVQMYAHTPRDGFTDRAPVGVDVTWAVDYQAWSRVAGEDATIVVYAPGAFVSASSDDGEAQCSQSNPTICRTRTNGSGFWRTLRLVTRMNAVGKFIAFATILGEGEEPDLHDNFRMLSFEVLGQPSLRDYGFRFFDYQIHPNRETTFGVALRNEGVDAQDVVVRLTLPNGGTFSGAGEHCTFTPTEAVCRFASIAYMSFVDSTVEILTPNVLDGTDLIVHADISAANAAPFSLDSRHAMVRHILVDNTADDGAGSLRRALIDARALCDPDWCTIDFRIPNEGVSVIEPITPLPPIVGWISVDGSTQKAFNGGTIELRGTQLISGSGLSFGNTRYYASISDLTIRDFPDAGVEVNDPITQCVAAQTQRVERSVLANNDIGFSAKTGCSTALVDNTITDNHHDGVIITTGNATSIVRNHIERNGASGIFIYLPIHNDRYTVASIDENVIAHNAYWGVARGSNFEMTMHANSIFDNGLLSIDDGLDQVTPERPNDSPGIPNAPLLVSATFDGTNTLVRGRTRSVPADEYTTFSVELFASESASPHPQAQRFLVSAQATANGEFEIAVPEDLRGKFVTATVTRSRYFYIPLYSSIHKNTSELSNAVGAAGS